MLSPFRQIDARTCATKGLPYLWRLGGVVLSNKDPIMEFGKNPYSAEDTTLEDRAKGGILPEY